MDLTREEILRLETKMKQGRPLDMQDKIDVATLEIERLKTRLALVSRHKARLEDELRDQQTPHPLNGSASVSQVDYTQGDSQAGKRYPPDA